MRLRWLLLTPALVLLSACPAPLVEHVRFRAPPGAVEIAGATPLFGSAEALAALDAGALADWRVVATYDVEATRRQLARAGATEISVRPRFEPAALPLERAAAPSCPVKTPAYDRQQSYRAALGIDLAWSLPGGRGQGLQVADVEGEWNESHEDLPTERYTHVAGRRMRNAGWRAHGTAVIGVVAARDNGVGMVGLAPEVDHIYTASLGQIGAARAFFEAAKRLNAGDVLIIELHGPGPNARGRGQQGFVPMEWWQPEYEAIRWASDQGIIVVEAGGNGGENLDAPIYQGHFDRAQRDSGAILVGAGAPRAPGFRERTRLGFSNYGRRVDLQGWGRRVATLDYGDLQGCDAPSRKYTAQFSGTSSASPVVAGAILAVQGAFKARTGAPLTAATLRNVLRATGTPQAGRADKEPIGPVPHVGRALKQLGLVE